MNLGLTSHETPKRLFEDGERVPLTDLNPQKRARNLTTSPTGRCRSSDDWSAGPAYSIGSAALTALRALFPEMDDKTITEVLAEYGSNVDAAIKHLNDLQLSRSDSLSEVQPSKATLRQQQEAKHENGSALAEEAPGSKTFNHVSAPGSDLRKELAHPGRGGEAKSQEARSNGQERFPTADEWIDELISQMSAATDVSDAKQRATRLLQALEESILARKRHEHDDKHGSQNGAEARLADMERENALLKRAVAIQNARLQELTGKEEEVAQLHHALHSAKERIQGLEVQNYSLQMHLKAAADAQDSLLSNAPRNPDIF